MQPHDRIAAVDVEHPPRAADTTSDRSKAHDWRPSSALLACCRTGFEPELAAELADAGWMVQTTRPGFVLADGRGRPPPVSELVFARSVIERVHPVALDGPDRVSPIIAALASLGATFSDVWLETPDTNDGKSLAPLLRAVEPRLVDALADRAWLRHDERPPRPDARAPRLHVFFADGSLAWVGTSDAQRGARWPMGIPRLRMPSGAPSRSTLKLAEALVAFLPESDVLDWLRPGRRAVDLGAAPGGWTWQLANRGVRVVAVDNGPLKGEVADDPLVEHVRADAFHYRPRRPVDWLLCDVVERPARIAALVAEWIVRGLARRAIFNLKLPMKKRYDCVRDCRGIVESRLEAAGVRHVLRIKQLYHDREEVTAYLRRA